MSRQTSNLGLILYDPSEDKDVKVRDVINKVLGFTDSNTIKIDTKTKDIDTNIKTLHDSIIGTDGNVVFYNKQEVFLAVHPVGSIFLSTSDVEPAGLYGGTWEKIAQDRVLMGASDTHPAGTTVEAGLPNITGGISGLYNEMRGEFKALYYGEIDNATKSNSAPWEKGKALYFDASRSNPIYGASTTVQPPAYCMYIWKRIE